MTSRPKLTATINYCLGVVDRVHAAVRCLDAQGSWHLHHARLDIDLAIEELQRCRRQIIREMEIRDTERQMGDPQ